MEAPTPAAEEATPTRQALNEIIARALFNGKDTITYNWFKYVKVPLPASVKKPTLWEELIQIPLLRPVQSKTRGSDTFIPVIETQALVALCPISVFERIFEVFL